MYKVQTNERQVLEKKFGYNDGTKPTVDVNTLLDPTNSNSAAQNITYEIKEVSNQLNMIKKKHDDTKKLSTAKQTELERTIEEKKQTEQQAKNAEGPVLFTRSRIEQLEEALIQTQKKIDEESWTQSSYKHMIERMEKDFIATRITSSEFEISSKSKINIMSAETQKMQKTKEAKLQSKAIFDSLMINIEKEQKNREDRILELQKSIKNKEESVNRRIERQRRNAEIAEAASNENKDGTEMMLRNQLFISKLWNQFMRKKMEKEMQKSSAIDEAFKAIKTATQVNDVQEMVKKFLTREQTYNSLLSTISQSESKIDELKKQNEFLTQRLADLTLDRQGPSGGEADSEIVMMQQEFKKILTISERLGDRFRGINIVHDQINNWARRCYLKFGLLSADPCFQNPDIDLVQIFASIKVMINQELESIARNKEDQQPEEFAEVFNDFASKEFICKNIRVRPISGTTLHPDENDGRASNASKGGDDQNVDSRYNEDALIEMMTVRKNIKMIEKAKLEAIRKKAEMEELKKKRKMQE